MNGNVKVFFLVLVWSLLIGPALHMGRVLQTHLAPSPPVVAEFRDGSRLQGRFVVDLDGGEWLVSEDGQRRSIQDVVSLIGELDTDVSSPSSQPLWEILVGVGPLIVLSAGFVCLFVRFSKKWHGRTES